MYKSVYMDLWPGFHRALQAVGHSQPCSQVLLGNSGGSQHGEDIGASSASCFIVTSGFVSAGR